MILAAGQGSRLKPITDHKPKAMVPLAGIPLIELTLLWLKSHQIYDAAINLFHMGDQIEAYLKNGAWLGMNLAYSREEKLLGTAGGVKRMEDYLGETFAVVYGDVFTNLNITAMIEFHRGVKAEATLALATTDRPSEVGVVEVDGQGRVLSFVEKPPAGTEPSNLCNAGVYILNRTVLKHVPENCYYDFGFQVFPRMLQANEPVYGYALKPDDYLIDIGNLERYEQARSDIESGKVNVCQLYVDCGGCS